MNANNRHKGFRVFAVVVLYLPDLALLRRVVDTTLSQVDGLVLVDNTPAAAALDEVSSFTALPALTLLRQNHNIGLAAGLNRGIEHARRAGADHFLLLDQDSVPAADMVWRLIEALGDASRAGWRIAGVGAAFEDLRGGAPPPFLRVGFPFNRVVTVAPDRQYVAVDLLITSGSLLSQTALQEVGPMNEWMFIDNVDIEWGFRAKASGWCLLGAPLARLAHRIGDEHVAAPFWIRWLFGRRVVVRHSDFRLYYIFRNRVFLYRLAHVPLLWKLQDLMRLPVKFFLCLAISDTPASTTKKALKGIWHGLYCQHPPTGQTFTVDGD